MIGSAIRELSASKDPVWVAAAFFEKTVQTWDVKSLKKVSEFPTVFCSGARNLTFAPSAQTLVAGLSTSCGKVTAYEARSGALLWERRLPYPSSLRFQESGDSVFCSCHGEVSIRLDAHTGVTVEVTDGVSQQIEGPYKYELIVPATDGNRPFRLFGKDRTFEIARLSFGVLDAKFSPDAVCLAEACGPVRCINYADGKQRWRFDPGTDNQIVQLHYSFEEDTFFGVLQQLTEKESRYLVRLAASTGDCERICSLDSWAEVFLAEDQLVTSAGDVRDIRNGSVNGRLEFPTRAYPED